MLVALRAAFLLIDAHASVQQWDASLPKRLNLGRFQWFASHCGALHRLTGLPRRRAASSRRWSRGRGRTVKNWQALYLGVYNSWMLVALRASFLLIDAAASVPQWDGSLPKRRNLGRLHRFASHCGCVWQDQNEENGHVRMRTIRGMHGDARRAR